MQTINLWNQFHLHRAKAGFFVVVLCLFLGEEASAQAFGRARKANAGQYTADASDALKRKKDRLTRPIGLGFSLAPLGSNFGVRVSDEFANNPGPNQDGIVRVEAKSTLGFMVGFYSRFRLSEFWDFRAEVNAAFYERSVAYFFQDGSSETKVVEAPMAEIPLMFKYRSKIRGATNFYLVGGIKPSFILSRRTEDDENLRVADTDLSVEVGVGMDVFFPYFKFAPELRFSRGLSNVKDNEDENPFTRPIRRLTTNTFAVIFHFGG